MKQRRWHPKLLRTLFCARISCRRLFARGGAAGRLSIGSAKRIVVGAGGTQFDGWTSMEQQELDLRREDGWAEHFKQDSLEAVLAEHVWEHLTPAEAAVAARHCFRFLKPGGYVRAAVPDGCHPDQRYVEAVRPGGTGSGADDHKVLYTYRSFREVFLSVGFEVSLLEYFDEGGKFHYREWSVGEGFIERSKRFDPRNADGRLAYTSIILDARKPTRLR
jgi:predicted SAM-dependent methyltransferase